MCRREAQQEEEWRKLERGNHGQDLVRLLSSDPVDENYVQTFAVDRRRVPLLVCTSSDTDKRSTLDTCNQRQSSRLAWIAASVECMHGSTYCRYGSADVSDTC